MKQEIVELEEEVEQLLSKAEAVDSAESAMINTAEHLSSASILHRGAMITMENK